MGNSNTEKRNNYDGDMSYDPNERMQRGLILWLFDPEMYYVQGKISSPTPDKEIPSQSMDNGKAFMENGLTCLNQENKIIEDLQSYPIGSIPFLILVIDAENPVHIEYIQTFFNPRYRYFKGNKDYFDLISKMNPSVSIFVVDQNVGKLLSTMVEDPSTLDLMSSEKKHVRNDNQQSMFLDSYEDKPSLHSVEMEDTKGAYWKYLHQTLNYLSKKLNDQSLTWPVSERGNRRLQQKINQLYAEKLDYHSEIDENKRKAYIEKHLSNLPTDRRGSFQYML